MKRLLLSAVLATLPFSAHAAEPAAAREPYGIGLEGFAYPYPVQMFSVVNEGEPLKMAYMDVKSEKPNGRTVLLLHGRNFPSSYWAPVIGVLTDAGYRVVVPDQIGFGKS
ncbi:MAG: alpha/beta hydrolase, partial [Tardiphaga sp.]|nr:alpha/beta hydrolase [Tardiphaga sp.]